MKNQNITSSNLKMQKILINFKKKMEKAYIKIFNKISKNMKICQKKRRTKWKGK